jgi:aspartate kinase
VLKTDGQFGSAIPNRELLMQLSEEKIRPQLKQNMVIVTQGFLRSTKDGLTTTLGRGGSDYTAALLGFALDADTIEIWTDVSGVMTADPRIVSNVFTQKDLSFKEAAELAYFGAKVLHPSTMLPAMDKKIPVIVKNTLHPHESGTTITPESKRPGICKAIAFRKEIMILTVESSRMLMAYGFLERIFEVFARNKISVDLISTSEISVSLTIDNSQFKPEIVDELCQFSKAKITQNMAIVAIVGENIKTSKDFLSKVFKSLNHIPIEMITFGASNVNLSVVVPQDQVEKSVKQLHSAFFENY